MFSCGNESAKDSGAERVRNWQSGPKCRERRNASNSCRVVGMWLADSSTMQTTNLSQMEKLIELYYQPLFRFAERLCGSPARAMLLTQQTFRQAFNESRGFPVPTNSRTWLYSILFNHFLEDSSNPRRA
jgi:hypothetical protein